MICTAKTILGGGLRRRRGGAASCLSVRRGPLHGRALALSHPSPSPAAAGNSSNLQYQARDESTSMPKAWKRKGGGGESFPRECCNYTPYRRAVDRILRGETWKRRKESLIEQGIWNATMFKRFEAWLTRTDPLLDEGTTSERWDELRGEWAAVHAANGEAERTERVQDRSSRSLLVRELATLQSRALMSAIFGTTSRECGDEASGERSRLLSSSFARMVRFVLVNNLLERSSAHSLAHLPVTWYKVKESGAALDPAALRSLIDAIAAAGLSELSEEERRAFDDIVVYHDMLLPGGASGDGMSDANYAIELEIKRRSFLLRYHCEMGNVDEVVGMMTGSQRQSPLQFDCDHCLLGLAALVKHGYFR